MDKKVLVIDNYDSFTYNLVHYIEANGHFEVDVFRNDEIDLAAVAMYSTIILSPGPGLPKDAGVLKEIITHYASTKKILGVCLGMQAIGEVFGSRLKNINPVLHGVSTSLYVRDKNDLLYQDLPSKFKIGRYHSWVISHQDFPKELLSITATDANNQIMSLKHIQYPLYGVQFHPESILTENGQHLIDNFLNS